MEFLDNLLERIQENPGTEVKVSLDEQKISFDDKSEGFEIDPYKKYCLQNGYDDIDFLISQKEKVVEYETTRNF